MATRTETSDVEEADMISSSTSNPKSQNAMHAPWTKPFRAAFKQLATLNRGFHDFLYDTCHGLIESIHLPDWVWRQITFYRIHLLSFIIGIFIGSFLIWLPPHGPLGPIKYIDALYCATSAATVTGLISVEIDRLATFDLVVLVFLMFFGSQVFTSVVPVYIRRFYFRQYLEKEMHSNEGGAAGSFAEGSHVDERQSAVGSSKRRLSMDALDLTNLSTRLQSLQRSGSVASGLALRSPARVTPAREFQQASPQGTAAAAATAAASVASGSSALPRKSPLDAIYSEQSVREWDIDLGHGPQATDGPSFGETGAAKSTAEAAAGGGPAVAARMPDGSLQSPAPPAASRFPRSGTDSAAVDAAAHRDYAVTWAGETASFRGEQLKATLRLLALQRERSIAASQAEILSSASEGQGEEGLGSEKDAFVSPGELRLIELHALRFLSIIVPLYLLGSILTAAILLMIVIKATPAARQVLSSNDVNFVFMAFFQSVSAFANAGFSLLDDNLISFNQNAPYLIIVAILILLGNTMFAPCLRGLLLLLHRLSRTKTTRLIYGYLLDHPRKCYTHLFPARQTIWLVITVIAFNLSELVAFLALDWNLPVLSSIPEGYRFLDGWFQSISTRNAGFNVLAIGSLSPPMLVLYTALMYVAVYPVFFTRQSSREMREVYDEKELGDFMEDVKDGVMDDSFWQQSQKLVGRDSVLLFGAIFFICVIYRFEINVNPNFAIFNIIFEVISAYGNVGLSIGYTCVPPSPDATCTSPPYSFSGTWNVLGKLIIISVMLLGRHRGLPDNIDAAIAIPDRSQFEHELKRRLEPGELVRAASIAPVHAKKIPMFASQSGWLGQSLRQRTPSMQPNDGGSSMT